MEFPVHLRQTCCVCLKNKLSWFVFAHANTEGLFSYMCVDCANFTEHEKYLEEVV